MAFGRVAVKLDDGAVLALARRELWDVRVQLMAEDDAAARSDGLGDHDVRTGVYEGGFKSWESSVDLVKVLASQHHPSSPALQGRPVRVIELGCGTALPSLAFFQCLLALDPVQQPQPAAFILADYNPSVLELVTLPNFLLAWALHHRHQQHPALADAFLPDDELQITPELLRAFEENLRSRNITLSFLSGGWSDDFVHLLYSLSAATHGASPPPVTLLLGAETIYSPFALQAFNETVFAILRREQAALSAEASALVAAKRLYFGVGGSLDDFVHQARAKGATVTTLREETAGVARGVVRCHLPSPRPAAS